MVHIFASWYFGVSNYGEVCLVPFNTDANLGHKVFVPSAASARNATK